MKKIIFNGEDYEVPEWTKFVTQATNGAMYAYENMPVADYDDMDNETYYYSNGGRVSILFQFQHRMDRIL